MSNLRDDEERFGPSLRLLGNRLLPEKPAAPVEYPLGNREAKPADDPLRPPGDWEDAEKPDPMRPPGDWENADAAEAPGPDMSRFEWAKPMPGPEQEQWANQGSVGRVMEMFGHAYGESATKNGYLFSPETEAALKKYGLFRGDDDNFLTAGFRGFNEAVIRPAGHIINALMGTWHGTVSGGIEAGVNKDVFGIAEMVFNTPGKVTGIGSLAQRSPLPPGLRRTITGGVAGEYDLRVAYDLGIIGKPGQRGELGTPGQMAEASLDAATRPIQAFHASPYSFEAMVPVHVSAGVRIEESAGAGIALQHSTYEKFLDAARKSVPGVTDAEIAKHSGISSHEDFIRTREAEIKQYVEQPVQDLVRRVYDKGGSPYMSNAYGPGERGVWYFDKSGKEAFDPLPGGPSIPGLRFSSSAETHVKDLDKFRSGEISVREANGTVIPYNDNNASHLAARAVWEEGVRPGDLDATRVQAAIKSLEDQKSLYPGNTKVNLTRRRALAEAQEMVKNGTTRSLLPEVNSSQPVSYQVRLHADPELMLDWDVPIPEQPTGVVVRLEKMLGELPKEQTVGELVERMKKEALAAGREPEVDVIERFREADIHGIRSMEKKPAAEAPPWAKGDDTLVQATAKQAEQNAVPRESYVKDVAEGRAELPTTEELTEAIKKVEKAERDHYGIDEATQRKLDRLDRRADEGGADADAAIAEKKKLVENIPDKGDPDVADRGTLKQLKLEFDNLEKKPHETPAEYADGVVRVLKRFIMGLTSGDDFSKAIFRKAFEELKANGVDTKKLSNDLLNRTLNSLSSESDRALIRKEFQKLTNPRIGGPSQRVTGFTTAKGSKYQVHEDGTTTRDKAARPEHPGDEGLKQTSTKTVYLTEEQANALAPAQGSVRFIDHKDGTISTAMRTPNGKDWGISQEQRNIKYSTEPAVGLTPLELRQGETIKGLPAYREHHFGNKITEVVTDAGQGRKTTSPENIGGLTPTAADDAAWAKAMDQFKEKTRDIVKDQAAESTLLDMADQHAGDKAAMRADLEAQIKAKPRAEGKPETAAEIALRKLNEGWEDPRVYNYHIFDDMRVEPTHKDGQPIQQEQSIPSARPGEPAVPVEKSAAAPIPDPMTGTTWWEDFEGMLEKIQTTDGMREMMRNIAQRAQGFPAARRGEIPLRDLNELSEISGVPVEQLDRGAIGRKMQSDEHMRVLGRIMLSADKKAHAAAVEAVAGGLTPELNAKFFEAKIRHQMVVAEALEQYVGLRAEFGRMGNAAQEFMSAARQAENIGDLEVQLHNGQGFASLSAAATKNFIRQVAAMPPGAVPRFLNAANTASRSDQLFYAYQNIILSGWKTQSLYAMADLGRIMFETLVVTPIAGTIGGVRSVIPAIAGTERVYVGETASRAFGYVSAIPKAIFGFALSLKTGVVPPMPIPMPVSAKKGRGSRVNPVTQAANPIGGVTGEIVGSPNRVLGAYHTFLSILSANAEIEAQAYRAAAKAGGNPLTTSFWLHQNALTKTPTPEMMIAANKNAEVMTYTEKLEHRGRNFQNFFRGTYDKETGNFERIPGFRWAMPFQRTPVNSFSAGLDTTPLAWVTPATKRALKGEAGAVAQDMAISRIIGGSALSAYAFYWALGDNMTANGPTDPKARAQWLLTHQPYSHRDGDYWRPYDKLWPIAAPMAAAADLAEIKDELTAGEWNAAAGHLAMSFGNVISSGVGMQMLANVFGAWKDVDRYGNAFADNLVAGVVPAFSAQTAAAMDPHMRDVKDLIATVKNRIPGLRETLPYARDWSGSLVPNPAYGPNPWKAALVNKDPLNLEMQRLNLWPRRPSDTIKGVKLDREQYDKYQEMAGILTRQATDPLVQSPDWLSIPPFARQDTIRGAIKRARTEAASAMHMLYPDLIQKAVEMETERLTSTNLQNKKLTRPIDMDDDPGPDMDVKPGLGR